MSTSVDTATLQRSLFASMPASITDGPALDRIRGNTDGWCLRIGHSGDSVQSMKALLENAGYEVSPGNVVDGKTDAAIRAFQAANGLEVDGKVGIHTLAALENLAAVPQLADAQTLADARTILGEDERALAPTVRGPELGGFYINPATGQVTQIGAGQNLAAVAGQDQQNLNGGNPLVAGLGLAGLGLKEGTAAETAKLTETTGTAEAKTKKLGEPTVRQRYTASQEAYAQKLRQEALGRDMAVLNKALDKEGAFVNAKPGETLEQLIKRSNGGQPGGTAERVIKELQAKGELRAYETTKPGALKPANPNDPFWATPKAEGPTVRQRYEAAQENAAIKLRQDAIAKEQAVLNQALDKNAAGVHAKPGESLDALIKRSNGGQPGGTAERVIKELRADGQLSAHDAPPLQTAQAPKGKTAGVNTAEPGLLDNATTKLKSVAQDSKAMADGALHANFSPGMAKAVHFGGRALVVAGAVMDGADVIGAAIDDVQRGDGHATQTIKTGSKVAGGWLGAMAGSAALGAAAGTIVPGLGNIAGFLVGAAGGAIGYALGSSGGEVVGEALAS